MNVIAEVGMFACAGTGLLSALVPARAPVLRGGARTVRTARSVRTQQHRLLRRRGPHSKLRFWAVCGSALMAASMLDCASAQPLLMPLAWSAVLGGFAMCLAAAGRRSRSRATSVHQALGFVAMAAVLVFDTPMAGPALAGARGSAATDAAIGLGAAHHTMTGSGGGTLLAVAAVVAVYVIASAHLAATLLRPGRVRPARSATASATRLV